VPAWDLVIHTGAVLETDFAKLRSMRAGRQLFWPNGQAALWWKIGLADVTEVPVVVDCEYACFADYWATWRIRIPETFHSRDNYIRSHVSSNYRASV
jgi:hypothetical protein